jgi:23S rRNA (adenine2503-C2)-methyltransferase
MATAPPHIIRSRFIPTRSAVDASVNWVTSGDPGVIEARYVRRAPSYFALYLSSQTGCRQACRMCHLTASGQTRARNVDLREYLEQAEVVLAHARTAAPAEVVHYNFMARGEPLSNPVLLEQAGTLFDGLFARASALGLRSRFLVSTILPKTLDRPLASIFDRYLPDIYYSLYSMDDAVRRRWLPNALSARDGLDALVAWQRHSYKIVKIHFAFIEGVNDDDASVHAICDAILQRGLFVHVNIVRYNPPTPSHGREPPIETLERNVQIFRERLPGARVQLVPRVGFDVSASCGMFVPDGPGDG